MRIQAIREKVNIYAINRMLFGKVSPLSLIHIFMGCDNLRYVLATGNKITTLGDNLFGESQGKIIYKEKQ